MSVFNKGQLVNVVMSRNNVFDWQTSPTIYDCIIVAVPCATGDSWVFENGGVKFLVNPTGSDFIGLEEKEDE